MSNSYSNFGVIFSGRDVECHLSSVPKMLLHQTKVSGIAIFSAENEKGISAVFRAEKKINLITCYMPRRDESRAIKRCL